MATGKVNSGEVQPGEIIENIPLRKIEFKKAFNTRSTPVGFHGQKTEDGTPTEDEESNSYSKNLISIATKGQDTPIIVRPNPDKTSKYEYSCVTGFTRGDIIAELAAMNLSEAKIAGVEGSSMVGVSDPTIKAVVRNLSDGEAEELNVRENTARLNPLAPDLAWGIYRIKQRDPKRSDQSIADSIGVSQPYVSRLLSIMGNFEDKVLTHWRNAANVGTTVLDTKFMHSLIKVDLKDRTAAYFDACKAKEASRDEANSGGDRWIDTAIEKSKALGELLGTLAREGYITCDTPAEEMMHVLLPLKGKAAKDAKPSHWARFAKACEKAYAVALDAPTVEEVAAQKAEEDEAKAKTAAKEAAAKGNKKNGKGASASA